MSGRVISVGPSHGVEPECPRRPAKKRVRGGQDADGGRPGGVFCGLHNGGVSGRNRCCGEGAGRACAQEVAAAARPSPAMLPNHQRQSVVLRQPTTPATVTDRFARMRGSTVTDGVGCAAPQHVPLLTSGGATLRLVVARETAGAREFVNQFPTQFALTRRGR